MYLFCEYRNKVWSTLHSMIIVILWPHYYHGKICRDFLIDNELPIVFCLFNFLLFVQAHAGTPAKCIVTIS